MAMNDLELDQLIRLSTPKPDFESAFQREIWARIAIAEQAKKKGLTAWIEAVLGALSRPAPAFATAAVMLLLGIGLGTSIPHLQNPSASRDAYLASINPLVHQGDTPR